MTRLRVGCHHKRRLYGHNKSVWCNAPVYNEQMRHCVEESVIHNTGLHRKRSMNIVSAVPPSYDGQSDRPDVYNGHVSGCGATSYVYTLYFELYHVRIKPQTHRLTTRLRPTCDRKMLESWTNRRKDVRLVAEVVGDRQGKISRSKVVSHVQNQSHQAYD